MQTSGIRTMQPNWLTSPQAPWLKRFAGKMVLDILPAALASVIGGFLFTQYHFGHAAPQLVAVQQASPEMMAMVRDEHAQIMNYLKAQVAAEKRRDAAEDAATARAEAQAQAAADAKLADLMASQAAEQAITPPSAAVKTAPSVRRKPPASFVSPLHAPLAIAQANQPAPRVAEAGGAGDRLAGDPDSLLAKTLDVKDQVVAATRNVVSAIGQVFNSVGGTIGGVMSSAGRPFNSES